MTKAEQKAEAIERLKLMGLNPTFIKDYEEKGTIKKVILNIIETDDEPPEQIGILTIDEPNEHEKEIIKMLNKHRFLTYYITQSKAPFGDTLISYFIITPYKEEWEQDKADIIQKIVYCYVENITDNSLSEYGSIGINTQQELIYRED